MEEKRYFIIDLETGQEVETTKEVQENWTRMINMLKPKVYIGDAKITVVGTAGDLDAGEDLKKIFYKPENYNVM